MRYTDATAAIPETREVQASSTPHPELLPVLPPFMGLRTDREPWQHQTGHPRHSHSIVAGGFPEMSYTTRDMPATSLMMR